MLVNAGSWVDKLLRMEFGATWLEREENGTSRRHG